MASIGNTTVKNSISKLVITLIIMILLTATQAVGREGNWINIALSGNPVTQDPKLVKDSLTLSVIHNTVFECLVRYGGERNLAIEPALAISWDIRDGGKTWIFTLRSGVRFHDGSLMTSTDVVESFKRDPNFTGKIDAVGADRVRMVFREKRAGYAKNISQVSSAVEKFLPDSTIVGTGPFRVSSWLQGESVELEAFDEYWGGRPKLDGVHFQCAVSAESALKMMKSGETDVVDIVPPSLVQEFERDPTIETSVMKGVNVSFVYLNLENPPLDSAEFRKALNMLIHTDKIIRDVHFDQAVSCRDVLPPVIGGKDDGPPRIQYRPKVAKEVIAGYLKDSDRVFRMIGLPFPRPYCPEPAAQARLIAGYLKGSGLKIEYQPAKSMQEYMQYMDNRDFDFMISGWVIDSRNPDDFFTALFGVGDVEPVFAVKWDNEEFESMIIQARQTVSVKRQWDLYRAASGLFFEDLPWILIAHTNQIGAYRKVVEGLKFEPTSEFRLHDVTKRGFD
ncbi:MAG: hypothetical protein KOO63_16040 [Bacteroidales bacterium]|nr:hypothetical protein [Candidatus Latescibacterota bacterium]